ncbi:MAG: SDR family NAD(P)-dependent oxidoreductase [Persicimonas sp.]
MSLFGRFKSAGPTGFGWQSTADDVLEGLDLSGRHMLVTGCNSGIGFETMRSLTEQGATVYGAARTEEKASDACARVDGEAMPIVCELGEPDSVRACAKEIAERPRCARRHHLQCRHHGPSKTRAGPRLRKAVFRQSGAT